jgi:hypothetical protein
MFHNASIIGEIVKLSVSLSTKSVGFKINALPKKRRAKSKKRKVPKNMEGCPDETRN